MNCGVGGILLHGAEVARLDVRVLRHLERADQEGDVALDARWEASAAVKQQLDVAVEVRQQVQDRLVRLHAELDRLRRCTGRDHDPEIGFAAL